jgi:fumarate hydratase subunit alpha
MAVLFIDIGQDVHIRGGSLEDAVNEGVRQAYAEGYLRKSVVADPLERVNTQDNTPAVIHERIVPGDKITITAMPKGFGSENMSALKLFNPSASEDNIIKFVVDSVVKAGGRPCPPVIIGVGIGGTAEKACLMAKHALTRDLSKSNENEKYAALEKKILEKVNASGVGPQGMGGDTTALAVLIEYYPTHIAGLPVAVSLGCHAGRHASATI